VAFYASLCEALMLLCFGAAWPSAIAKTLRVKRVEGKSILFLWLVLTGYAAGLTAKLLADFDWVVALYALNFCLVGTEILLYYRYRPGPQGPAAPPPAPPDPAP
jgi:hypothetical protein